ncbi:hypothetical protein RhiirC2_715909 [Rhizophagus irregularis]|uniref:Uncharacterized protein n=1 Tax=Rhizophagus irregularis TaxID=588596 RepID=A0A2N1MTH2_9GLOM|nr:hypothetical protein RhiirC2_715909 [Rhizophagus irregularis]
MVKRWARFKKQLGDDEIDELLAAEINAMVVKDSEEYYRTMIGAGTKSWNLRDSHMLRMLEALMKYLECQRNSITKNALDIDIRNSVEKNIHQIFEVNDDEVISLL